MKLSNKLSDEKAAEIAHQQYFETLKHLTTIDTGAIFLLAVLMEKVFVSPEWKFLIPCSFILLTLSILACIYLMFWNSIASEDNIGTLNRTGFSCYLFAILMAFWFFVLGIIAFTVFAVKNI
jgi:hypothetical protein